MNPTTPTSRSAPLNTQGAAAKPDVRAYIAEQAALAKQAPQVSMTAESVPLTKELEGFVAKAEMQAKLPEPEIPAERGANPDLTGADTLKEAALEASMAVSLTQDDRDAFCKSCLFDTPTELIIPVLGGKASVRVRTLTIMHEDILAWWLQDQEQQKSITSQSRWLVMFQRAHVLLRVMTLEDKSTTDVKQATTVYDSTAMEAVVAECQKASVITPELKAKAIETLQTHVHNTYRAMTPPRYGMLQQAVGLAERKFNALVREAASGNF